MKVFYYCCSGIHAAAVAAALHLGHISGPPEEAVRELERFKYFDYHPPSAVRGTPLFMGSDTGGNQVYTIPVDRERFLAPKAIRGLMRIFKIPVEEILLVDTLKHTTTVMKLGAFVSQKIGLKVAGRRILYWAVEKTFDRYTRQVEQVKKDILSLETQGALKMTGSGNNKEV